MYLHRFLTLSALAFAACSSEPKPASTVAPEPGFLGRFWNSTQKLNPLRPSLRPREMKPSAAPNLHSLAASLSVEPPAPKLSEVRQMAVTMRVDNRSKHVVRLDFPSTQRVEVVIKDASGKVIERWSEDHRFENQTGMVTINPAERIEYTAQVATREMAAGQTYTLEAWLPAYESLRATATLSPIK